MITPSIRKVCKVIPYRSIFLGKIKMTINLGKCLYFWEKIAQLCNCKVAKLVNWLIILMLCKCNFITLQLYKVIEVIANQYVMFNFANFANFASAFS